MMENMSDRYLFKAKRTDNRGWVEGCYIFEEQDKKRHYIGYIFGSDGRQPHDIDAIEIDAETLCQYTGLHDGTKWEELSKKEQQQFLSEWNYEKDRKKQKEDWNGKKIWEGDILSAHLDDEYPDDVTYVEIKWNGFSWCIREGTEDDVMTEYDCNTFEVIGNIFDNPELLGDTD